MECSDSFDVNHFAICCNLRSLVLRHYQDEHLSAPLDQPIFQQLERISLSHCLLTSALLGVLAQCEHLVEVEYKHSKHAPLTVADHTALWPYFQRMRTFGCQGDVGAMLTEHFPQRELGLVRLCLDHASSSISQPDAVGRFLRDCPQLTALDMSKCYVSFESLLDAMLGLRVACMSIPADGLGTCQLSCRHTQRPPPYAMDIWLAHVRRPSC